MLLWLFLLIVVNCTLACINFLTGAYWLVPINLVAAALCCMAASLESR